MFDRMPPCCDGKKPNQTAVDHISALPVELLHRVLYFLSLCEIARTSVLSRHWRNVWKSMTALRIIDVGRPGSAADFNTVINSLLLFRDRANLLEFELCTYYHEEMRSHDFEDTQEVDRYLDMWIRHALMCKVRLLKVVGMSIPRCRALANGPLISKEDLKILKLWSVSLECSYMDFSRCEKLEELMMDDCIIYAEKISSQSLRSLCVCGCYFSDDIRTQIYAPGLNSLQVDGNSGMTPFLASMPLLVTAYIRLCHTCEDHRDSEECVLLKGLSDATTLELIAEPGVTIFKQDLNLCPMFNKLRTLVLNGEVVDFDGAALIRFIQHVPVPEKLTLEIYGEYDDEDEMEESCSEVKQLLQHGNLRVEVRCNQYGSMVHSFVRILTDNGINSIIFDYQ